MTIPCHERKEYKMRRKRTLPKYLTAEEIEALFSVIDDARDRAIFRVVYRRGLRASEVGPLRTGDYGQHRGRLFVRRLKESKSGEFLLTDVENQSITEWLKERGHIPRPLFPSRNRTPISRRRTGRTFNSVQVSRKAKASYSQVFLSKSAARNQHVSSGRITYTPMVSFAQEMLLDDGVGHWEKPLCFLGYFLAILCLARSALSTGGAVSTGLAGGGVSRAACGIGML